MNDSQAGGAFDFVEYLAKEVQEKEFYQLWMKDRSEQELNSYIKSLAQFFIKKLADELQPDERGVYLRLNHVLKILNPYHNMDYFKTLEKRKFKKIEESS